MRQRRTFAAVAVSVLTASLAGASVLTPPTLPLIVRNPYLNTHLSNARDAPWSKWPIFWTGEEIGFSILASVGESATLYPLLGRAHDSLEDDDGYTIEEPSYLGANFDASTTNLTYHIPNPNHGSDLELILSFLSPITPSSTLRQSLPAAYVTVYVEGSFDVNVYIDVNGQWVSGNREPALEWDLKKNTDNEDKELKTWVIKKRDQQLFTEVNDRSEWGALHVTAPSDVHHDVDSSQMVRRKFARSGTLSDGPTRYFWGVSQREEPPVFAFSKSFRLSSSDQDSEAVDQRKRDSVLFTIAHIQEPIAQYASARGLTYMRPLWQSWFSSDEAMLSWHYHDFKHANKLAQNYTDQVGHDAYQSGGENYRDIIFLSARQSIGGTSFVGTPDSPLLFLKEISSNGNSQTIDVIFPAFPFFLYTNPRWLAYLLEPLIEHMLSGQYPRKSAMHDLGTHFPNLTGHADGNDEYMPVEECGDILIMGLALVNSLDYGAGQNAPSIWSSLGRNSITEQQLSQNPFALAVEDDGEVHGLDDSWGGTADSKGLRQAQRWVGRSYEVWKQWTEYLIEYTLEPENQLSTDDFAGWLALQTNLALKGIIGIKAMSELSEVIGNDKDAKYYRNISEVYIKKWEKFGMSRDGSHAKLAYDWYGSWTTLYSLYADAILCFHPSTDFSNTSAASRHPHDDPDHSIQAPLRSYPPSPKLPHSRPSITSNFIPSHIYTRQSSWYWAVHQTYGLPLDSRHLYTKSDWEFEAAAVASPSVRALITAKIAKWLNETSTDRPFTDLYETEGDGGWPGPHFFNRPVVGAHFASLALERACQGRNREVFAGMNWGSEEMTRQEAEWAVLREEIEVLTKGQQDEEAREEVEGDFVEVEKIEL
ncbi:glutaminase A [Viridothelium virens]|uniref:Glutaminase A n=1 Tax=Viridothelium virens TaxID=1048519 RepID=A0A6A6H8V4_VIRVR|nr:glutaminase A [Viridothelium virens]